MTFPPRAIVAAVPTRADARRDPPDLKRAKTVEKGHGRIETRSIQVRTKDTFSDNRYVFGGCLGVTV